jgi:hypothetical protein
LIRCSSHARNWQPIPHNLQISWVLQDVDSWWSPIYPLKKFEESQNFKFHFDSVLTSSGCWNLNAHHSQTDDLFDLSLTWLLTFSALSCRHWTASAREAEVQSTASTCDCSFSEVPTTLYDQFEVRCCYNGFRQNPQQPALNSTQLKLRGLEFCSNKYQSQQLTLCDAWAAIHAFQLLNNIAW